MGAGDDKDAADAASGGVYFTAFRKLPEQSATTIRFFEKNSDADAYIVFEKDAVLASKEVFQTNAVIKTYGSGTSKIDLVNINRARFESWVRDLLLIKQYRVEVYANSSSAKGRIDWVIQYRGSPGNLTQFEDLLFANSEVTVNNGTLGVRISYTADRNKTVGVSYVNMNEWQIHLLEFLDNDALTTFESIVVQLSPKEAVLPVSPSHAEDTAALKTILERNGVLVNERKLSDFDSKDLTQDLMKLLKLKKDQNMAADPELEKTTACSSLCGVIKYLELLSGDAYLHQFAITPHNFELYAKMDSAACRALHLTLNNLEQSSGNETTLMSVLDKCRTSQGKRLLAQFLKQPLIDKDKLEERLDIVEALVGDIVLRKTLCDDHLRRIPDCQVLSRKLLKKRATLQDCYKGYMCISRLPNLLTDLEAHDGPKSHVLASYFCEPIKAMQEDLNKFNEMISTTLDIAMAEKGDFVVKSDIHEDFQVLRSEMDEIEVKMAEETYSVAKDLSLEANKSLKLESNTQTGHFFRITLKEEKSIRNNPSYSIIHSTKGGVAFRNTKLELLSERYRAKHRKYEEEQKDIVRDILDVAAGYSSCFQQLGHLISILDVLTNFADVSASSSTPYVRPVLHSKGTGVIKLEGLRHPCVEAQPNVNYIPNDIHFVKDKQMFYIVTGPNMGGKSTFLRSVGIASLLAQVGCFVPASCAELSIVDGILARVGAGDSLNKGVSTFMAEMIETSFILKTATADTLVLIDELGRGTSTYDGFGLCWAISERLAKVGCFCVLATHFHELTSLSEEAKGVVNVHFSAVADENGLAMLYKLENGSCDRSFGIHVTTVTDFPPHVIKTAKTMAKKLEDFAQDEDKDDDEEAVKRRQREKKTGLEAIEQFKLSLKDAYEKCNSAMERGEIDENEAELKFQAASEKLLSEITEKAAENPYLKHLLDQSKN
ncbi:DNA mismatch repair protein Msh2 [Orchesella cincta]|uniref:DNA mismatch repair protein Msh2 n=1 Tax=Orchesella cincta TaxID=48709 RepID=A0A1D2N654_ORCCI|nr:DNA mismatch repair protein Msh2 [Orchesella cincta]